MTNNDITKQEVGTALSSDVARPFRNLSSLSMTFQRTFIPKAPSPWFSRLIPFLSITASFLTFMGIIETICYSIYYSHYVSILPLVDVLIPIVGGGPLQLALILSALFFWQYKSRSTQLYCFSLLSVSFFAGILIPATSLALNSRASSSVTSIVTALQTAPPSVLASYAEQYQSCTYNIPANDTQFTLLDIVPQYLDSNCKYEYNTCSIPIRSCTYSSKSGYFCIDTSQTQSTQGPCNTLARVVYQVGFDWAKYGKTSDGSALAVGGFWLFVGIIFLVKLWLLST